MLINIACMVLFLLMLYKGLTLMMDYPYMIEYRMLGFVLFVIGAAGVSVETLALALQHV